MKSLIKNIALFSSIITLRNLLKIRPVPISIRTLETSSISDAFAWRTDNNFTTKFKYSDILNIFYKIKDSWVEIHFFSKENLKLISFIIFLNIFWEIRKYFNSYGRSRYLNCVFKIYNSPLN